MNHHLKTEWPSLIGWTEGLLHVCMGVFVCICVYLKANLFIFITRHSSTCSLTEGAATCINIFLIFGCIHESAEQASPKRQSGKLQSKK